MPRIPFTDLASSPEFKSLPVEDQQKVSENYWNEVAAEQPDRAEFYGQMRDASKSLFDLKAKRNDAAPVQRRFLDAQVQDTAFVLSLGDEAAAGRLTPEGRDQALKLRETEQADRKATLDKTASLFTPEVQKQMAPAMDALMETAARGGVFGSARLDARAADFLPGGQKDVVSSSKSAYTALRDQMAADFNLEPGEVDDVVKHQLNLQEEPVSRDAFGTPHIKDEIIAAGPKVAEEAINNSNLPWSVKQEMVKDLPVKIDKFRSTVLERVRTESPELAKELGIDQPGDDLGSFQKLVKNLNDSRTEQFGGGVGSAALGTLDFLGQMLPTPSTEAQIFEENAAIAGAPAFVSEADKTSAARGLQKKVDLVNQLSSQFNKSKTEIWGTDAAAFGSGAYSVVEAVALGVATAGTGATIPLTRIATMGKTGARLAGFANRAIATSPVAGFVGAKTAAQTYEQAISAGKTEDEAFDLAARSGAIEAGVTMLFSGIGLGGTEDVGQMLAGGALRQSARESAKSAYRMFGEKLTLGISGEQLEENLITALDAVTVQAKIDPTMTVDDFKKQLRDTALVTLAVSGPTVGLGSLRETLAAKPTYQKTDEELRLEADLNLADAATTQPGEADIPTGGPAAPDAAPDGGAVAPGAPGPVAPGSPEPVAGPEPVAAEAVPGVQSGVAAEPVLVPADAGVAVQETPVGEPQTGLPVANEEQTAPVVGEPAAAPAAELPSEATGAAAPDQTSAFVTDVREPSKTEYDRMVRESKVNRLRDAKTRLKELTALYGPRGDGHPSAKNIGGLNPAATEIRGLRGEIAGLTEELDARKPKAEKPEMTPLSGVDPKKAREGLIYRAVYQGKKAQIGKDRTGKWYVSTGEDIPTENHPTAAKALAAWAEIISTTTNDTETADQGDRGSVPVRPEEDGRGEGEGRTNDPGTAGAVSPDDAATRNAEKSDDSRDESVAPQPTESETEPITQPTEPEPEPDWGTVFETLRDREPATKQVDTESPKFKELVSELKNNRVAEAAGKLEQKKADIAEMRETIKQERIARNKERLEKNRKREASRPLDVHQKKIKELTKGGKYPDGIGHGNSNAIKQWLVARGLNPNIEFNKDWRAVALRERPANSTAKTERIRGQFDKLTPEAKEVVEAFHKMRKKGAEQKESVEVFFASRVGQAIRGRGGLKSKRFYRDRKLPVPKEYNDLSERVPPQLSTAIFNNSETAADVTQVAGDLGMIPAEFWGEFWNAVNSQIEYDQDQDAYMERKAQEVEDRELAFAEQQLKALEGDAQTVDLREVRDGDTFTLGGVDYTATGVEADRRGQTQSFTLRGDGPLRGTEVAEDFFAESVTPTEGSLAHVDPAEIEAIRIAQEFPEDFEDVTEPAPTATEPEAAPQAQTPPPQAQTETPQPVSAEPAVPVQAQTEPEQAQTPPPPPAEPVPAPVAELEDPDVVGMQNAATDRRRQRANLPERFAPARLTNQAAWDEAMRRINKDPAAGRDLVNDLRKTPRSIDPVETALFTHELLVREQRLDDAYSAYNKEQNPETDKDMKEASAAVADAILTAERIGTIEGRALQARKILVHQDFTLARAVAKMTAANGGKPLSVDQTKEVAELHKKMQELQTQLAAAQEQIAKEEAQRVHVTVVADYKKGLRETKKRGEKAPSWIDRQADEARARILARKREGRLNSLPLDELLDHAIVGVSYLKNGLVSIGEFTTQLVKDFGRKVLPFANDIFAKSQELYGAAAPSSKVKSREDVLEDIDPEAPLNDKAIFQLVRHYINEGVDGFEPVMQAVLNDLREFYPDLTLREVHDAYSKYGQTRLPSQEEDLKLAREYRELSRLQSQLEDAEKGLAPLKTGLQREKATKNVRDLTKQVKDTMRRLGIRPTTEDGQLRSSFDAIKTRLRNEYEDLDTAIRKGEARKERAPQQFTPEEEAELKALRQRRDDRKADYEAIFKKKGLTDQERLDRAERLLDRRIAEERDMLEKGILKRNREMLMGPFSPALKSRRETLDKLKAERRELQKAARPKTPELEQKYKRDLASLERRIKEEEKLLAEGLTARQRDFKMGRWTPEMAAMQARLDGLRDARRELAESRKPVKSQEQSAYERSVRTIEAAIQRYKDIIDEVTKPGKPTFTRTIDAELRALMDQRDALREAAAEVLAADPARRDKRKQALLQTLYKSITEITRKIQDGDLSTKGRTDFFANDPDVAKIRAARDLLNKTLAAMRKDALPKRSPEEIRASRDQKLIENKIAKLRDRLARNDYAPRPKLPPPNYAGRDALLKEKKRLESKFNTKLLELELANRSLPKKIFDNTVDLVFGVSRAMLTSFDAGAFGRQAGLVNFMRPGLALRNFPANFAFTEKAATRYETAMESDSRWARAQGAGLALTTWRPGSSLSDMEEVYRSRIAKKIPGVAASERAYVTYLNQVRFTYFNALMNTLPVAHQTEENMKFLARHVNMMTGRGKMSQKMEGAAAALASVFFSPKYWWSRLQVLGNLAYIPLDMVSGFRLGSKETRIARQIVAVEYARLIGSVGLVFSLFAFAKDAFDWDDEEFTIGHDPRSSDFGKLRIGDTRIDFMAGLLQNVVFLARMGTGEKVTAGGEVVTMSGPDAGFKETRLGEATRLLRTKLSPAAGSIANALDGADVVGNKFTWETEILGSYIPMSAAETYSSIRELGLAPGIAAGLLGFIGIGASTYGGEEDYVIEQDIFTGRILEPFGIKPGTFFIDQSRYEKEVKEKGWVIPKSKGLPTF